MIFEDIIREAVTPAQDPLESAQRHRRMKVSGEIIAQRYEELHRGALQRVRASVPTEGQVAGCGRVAS